MDNTLLLLFLTFSAFCWWFKIQLDENKQLVQESERKEQDRLDREKRVKQLTNR